jgi:hypothetical protein
MTIWIQTAKAGDLTTAGTSDNPIIAYNNLGSAGTWSTSVGTEVLSAAYAATGTTYDQWTATPNGSNNATLQVDLGGATDIDLVAIAAHNVFTRGASIRVDSSPDAATWTLRGATQTPTDNQAIAWYFQTVSARYWRFAVTNATGGNVYIGVAFVGGVLTMPQRVYQGYTPPLSQTLVDLQSNVSEGGHLLGSAIVRKSSSASVGLRLLKPDFVRGLWLPFQRHFNEGKGFFWAWRPTKYGDLHYAWRGGEVIAPSNSGPKEYMETGMEMRLYDNP